MIIAFSPSPRSDFARRRWEHFGELGRRLLEEHEDWYIELLGTKDQSRYLNSIVYEIDNVQARLAVSSSVYWFARDMENYDLLVCVNSFPMHLAAALGVPTVAIIGNTPAEVVVSRVAKKFVYVENVDNINDITVDEVMEKITDILLPFCQE